MVTQYNEQKSGSWWNPLNWGGGFSSQLGQEGDASIGSGLINVTKKEQRVSEQNTFQQTDARDLSTSSIYSPTTSKNFTLTNAPTLVFNSPYASTSGSRPNVDANPSISPSVETKKEQSSSQGATSKADQSTGLDLEKIALYGAIGGVAYLLLAPRGRKK